LSVFGSILIIGYMREPRGTLLSQLIGINLYSTSYQVWMEAINNVEYVKKQKERNKTYSKIK